MRGSSTAGCWRSYLIGSVRTDIEIAEPASWVSCWTSASTCLTSSSRPASTVSQVIDEYLAAASFGKAENTALSYRKALDPVLERYGQRKARKHHRRRCGGAAGRHADRRPARRAEGRTAGRAVGTAHDGPAGRCLHAGHCAWQARSQSVRHGDHAGLPEGRAADLEREAGAGIPAGGRSAPPRRGAAADGDRAPARRDSRPPRDDFTTGTPGYASAAAGYW
jgi:hypothetical protein